MRGILAEGGPGVQVSGAYTTDSGLYAGYQVDLIRYLLENEDATTPIAGIQQTIETPFKLGAAKLTVGAGYDVIQTEVEYSLGAQLKSDLQLDLGISYKIPPESLPDWLRLPADRDGPEGKVNLPSYVELDGKGDLPGDIDLYGNKSGFGGNNDVVGNGWTTEIEFIEESTAYRFFGRYNPTVITAIHTTFDENGNLVTSSTGELIYSGPAISPAMMQAIEENYRAGNQLPAGGLTDGGKGDLYADNDSSGGGGLYGDDDDGSDGFYPIVLDLDGNGLEITELSQSNVFMDAAGTGLKHRTAWAAAGDGVLFYDPDNRNAITEKRQYVFTEWDPTAKGDLEAVRNVWDSNGDGKLTAADADFAKFKLLVTQADGSQIVQTLTQAGITEINLKADQTNVQYADGSAVTGQTTFTRSNATTGTVANMLLATES